MLRGWMFLVLGMAALAPAGAAGYRNEIAAFPARVEEERPFHITVSYSAPAAATLHCELKNPENIVIGGQTATVTGEGTREFTLQAPARSTSAEVLVGVWLGDDWQKAFAPIRHTPPLRVISHADQGRLDAMQSDAQAALTRLGYRRSGTGTLAILDDDLPGLDRQAPRLLAAELSRRGFAVTRLDAAALANPYVLTREHFDALVLTDSRVAPADALEAIQAFAESGGNLVALGGPAFTKLAWRAGDRWLDRQGVLDALARAPGSRVFLNFEGGDASQWERATNAPDSPSSFRFDAPGAGGSGHGAHAVIANLTGWDTFASPALKAPFPAGHTLTCFWARGDANTSQLSVEWREKDGSRWIAVAPLTPEWRRVALPPSAFRYWHDSASQGRGGAGDHFNPANAERLIVGLALTHTTGVGTGRHEFFLDEIATAPMPPEITAVEAALNAGPGIPTLEGISPAYKIYPVNGPGRLSVDTRQLLWRPSGALPRAALQAVYPRPQGTGFGKERRWRWIPLLQAMNADGKPGGAAAALLLNGQKPYEGGRWLTMPVADPAFFRNPAVVKGIGDLVARMTDGVFLYEGGTKGYAYFDGEAVEYGAQVVNWGKRPAAVEVVLRIRDAKGATVLESRFPLALAPGKRESVQGKWSPGHFAGDDYRVSVSLLRGGKEIDRLEHPLSVWRPAAAPQFVTTRAGNFYLNGRKWYPHGVNYMPSSGIGIEDGSYFEYWVDAQPYDPDVVERDLQDIQAIGFNMVSVFIYYRSLESRNLTDLLIRCRRHGLKVNLSLRPGTPLEFRWDEMRALVERYRLAQNDTVFAYDLAWEPVFGSYPARVRWDGDWEKWILARYGSLDAAEKAWGVPVPRAEGKVTGPSDQQVGQPGPWLKLAADYRRFVDGILHQYYGEARRLMRGVDPHHLVSCRMNTAGDPTTGQENLPFDFKGLNGAVDILCPEGYGRIGDWNRVKDGWFTTAYARCVAPDLPVMWAEFGYTVWDESRIAPSEKTIAFTTQFYRDFYEMVLRSGANGSVCWWFPGGYRCGERSDFGILNPDRTWRPITRVIHEYAPRLTAERAIPQPNVWLPARRDAHADGIRGIYAEVRERFWQAIGEQKTPGLRWEE